MQFRLGREPTFHFLLIAAGISVFYWLFNNSEKQVLQIDWQEVESRILLAELDQGYPAAEEQRRSIEESVVDDYVLVLEAYRSGLQNDARINEILAQKMRHVLSGNIIQPEPGELRAHYEGNQARYGLPARVTVAELVFLGPALLPEQLLDQLDAGIPAAELETDLNRIVGTLPLVTQQDLGAIFAAEFAARVFAASAGQWIGPFTSNRGQHWLQVMESTPARIPAFEEIEEQVRLDWIAAEEESRLAVDIARLRNGYEINLVNRP